MNQCICLDITEILQCHVFSNTLSLPAAASSVSAKWRSSFRKRTSGTINIKRRTKGSCAKGSTITCNHVDGREAAAHVRRNINKRRKGKLGSRSFQQKDQGSLRKVKRCQVNYHVYHQPSTIVFLTNDHCFGSEIRIQLRYERAMRKCWADQPNSTDQKHKAWMMGKR